MLDGTGDGDARIGGFTCSDANPILVSDALLGEGWGTMYISVPAYNVPATTNVLATPLIESAKAPGLCQYLNPIVCGPIPPELMQMAMMKKAIIARTLILEQISLISLGNRLQWAIGIQREPKLHLAIRQYTKIR